MQLALWHILILAVVQGITEFLPISSSGHLVVLSAFIAAGNPEHLDVADLNVVLHIGTLFSIIVFYWHRIWRLTGRGSASHPLADHWHDPGRRARPDDQDRVRAVD